MHFRRQIHCGFDNSQIIIHLYGLILKGQLPPSHSSYLFALKFQFSNFLIFPVLLQISSLLCAETLLLICSA
jgi:hypothetical protein